MIVVIHGITGSDNHSAVVGALEANSTGDVKLAIQKFFQSQGRGPLNRLRFGQLAQHSGLKIFPITAVNFDEC